MIPAFILMLLTMVAALKILGKDFRVLAFLGLLPALVHNYLGSTIQAKSIK